MNNPHGNMVDLRDPAKPILLVADRGHGRIVRYTLDDKPIDIVEGTRQPCHFYERKGEIVVPDLSGPVHILDKDNNVIVQLGDNPNVAQRAENKVKQADTVPGHFCCPHGATWDSHGNIFVAEWLPYGRFTKLQRLA